LKRVFSEYIGNPNVILTNSGKDALKISLLCSGVSPGDEVILPSFTCPSVAMAVLEVNAVPVFADVIENGFNISLDSVKEAINEKTKAIIVAHMAGIPVDLDGFLKLSKERGIILIEDCAQAFGAKYKGKYVGLHGDAAIYSFGISKNIGGVGGGALVLNGDINIDEIYSKLNENRFDFKAYLLAFLVPFVFESHMYPLLLPILEKQKDRDVMNMMNYPNRPQLKKISHVSAYFAKNRLLEYESMKKKRNQNAEIYKKNFSNILGTINVPDKAEPAYLYYPGLLNEKHFAGNLCNGLLSYDNVEVKSKANMHFMALWHYTLFAKYHHYGENVLDIEDRYVLFPLDHDEKSTEYICEKTLEFIKKGSDNNQNRYPKRFIGNLRGKLR